MPTSKRFLNEICYADIKLLRPTFLIQWATAAKQLESSGQVTPVKKELIKRKTCYSMILCITFVWKQRSSLFHYMEAPHKHLAYWKKAWWKLHENATSSIAQILKVTSHKTAAVRPLTSHLKIIQISRTRHTGHFWRSKDKLKGDVLM